MKYLLIFAVMALLPAALLSQTAIPRALTVAGDGTVLVATTSSGQGGVMEMKLTRYNPDGSLRGHVTRNVDLASPALMQMIASDGGDVVIAGTGGDVQSPGDILVFGLDLSTIVSIDAPGSPSTFTLSPAYPNPVTGSGITVTFQLERETAYRIAIRDISGREVRQADAGILIPGVYERRISTRDLGGGTYFLVFETPQEVVTRKIMIVQ